MLPSPAWPKQATGKPNFFCQRRGETKQVLQASARHDNILVELDQAGVTQEKENSRRMPQSFSQASSPSAFWMKVVFCARSIFAKAAASPRTEKGLAIQLDHDERARTG